MDGRGSVARRTGPEAMRASSALIGRRLSDDHVIHDFALVERCDNNTIFAFVEIDASSTFNAYSVARSFRAWLDACP